MNDEFRYIAAIAEHGSISKAARAIHISQPGLSQRLRRLEDQLGCELFDRSVTPLAPTPSGEVFIKYALRAIAAENSMRQEMRSALNPRYRRLRVGISAPRANALLGGIIVDFYESHRGCTLELKEMSSLEQLHRLFLGDEVDFAVLTPISPDPALYDIEMLCHERLVVVASRESLAPQLTHANSGKISLQKLEGMPFVLPSCGSYFDPLITQMIESSHAQLDIVVRNCSAELALTMVRYGLGAAIVPSTWTARMQDLITYELDGAPAGNALRYIRRSDRKATNEELLFMDILRKRLSARLR